MIKLYFKLFSLAGGVFSLWIFLAGRAGLAPMPPEGALAVSLGYGIVFGLLLSLIVGTLHIIRARKIAGENPEGDIYATTQRREIKSALPRERVFAMLAHYLKEVAGFKLTETYDISGKLEAVSPVNLKTFGSRVTVTTDKTEGTTCVLTVVCKPRLITTLADYGESLKTVMDIVRYMRESEQ